MRGWRYLLGGVLVPFGVSVPSGAMVSPYLSRVSPGGVGLLLLGSGGTFVVDGGLFFDGVALVPFGVSVPSGATVSP